MNKPKRTRLAAVEREVALQRKVIKRQIAAIEQLTRAHEQQREVIVDMTDMQREFSKAIYEVVRNWLPQR